MNTTVICTIKSADGSIAVIKQHSKALYSLTITSRHTGHNRWGSLDEIIDDARFFLYANRLPQSSPVRPW